MADRALGNPLGNPLGLGRNGGNVLKPVVNDIINSTTIALSGVIKGPTLFSKYRITVVGAGGAGWGGDIGYGGGGGGAASTDIMPTNGFLDLSYSVAPATVLGGSAMASNCTIAGFGMLTGNGGQNGAAHNTVYTPALGGTATGGARNFSGGNGGQGLGPSGTPFSGSGGGGAAGTFGPGGRGGNVIDRTTTEAGLPGVADGGGGGGGGVAQNGAGGGGGIGRRGGSGDMAGGAGVTLIETPAIYEVFFNTGLRSTAGANRPSIAAGGAGGVGGGGGGGPGYSGASGYGGKGGCGLVRIELWP